MNPDDASTSWGGDDIPVRRQSDETDLVQLVYTSEATVALDPASLGQIEASARRNNARAALTGFLFYQELKFYGLLEGPREALLDRMEAIIGDARHRRLRVLREEDIESRRFRNWSFAILPPPSARSVAQPVSEEFIRTLASRLS